MPTRRSKDSPAKLARLMKKRWRVVLLRSKGELLGYVDAHDAAGAEAAAAEQFRSRDGRRGGCWSTKWADQR